MNKNMYIYNRCMDVEPKIVGVSPQIIHLKNRVFRYFHHPFWGKHPYFGNTRIMHQAKMTLRAHGPIHDDEHGAFSLANFQTFKHLKWYKICENQQSLDP